MLTKGTPGHQWWSREPRPQGPDFSIPAVTAGEHGGYDRSYGDPDVSRGVAVKRRGCETPFWPGTSYPSLQASQAKWEWWKRWRTCVSARHIGSPEGTGAPEGWRKGFLEGTNFSDSNGLWPFKGPQYVNSYIRGMKISWGGAGRKMLP